MAFVGSITVGGAILGAGALGAGASLGSALIGSSAAGKASSIQAQAAANSLALQREMFETAQRNYKPYLDVGKGATYTLGSFYGIPGEDGKVAPVDYSQFYNSPDY